VRAGAISKVVVGGVCAGETAASERVIGSAVDTHVEALSEVIVLAVGTSRRRRAGAGKNVEGESVDALGAELSNLVEAETGQARSSLGSGAPSDHSIEVDVGRVRRAGVGIGLPGNLLEGSGRNKGNG
jgi:hypothetical protein